MSTEIIIIIQFFLLVVLLTAIVWLLFKKSRTHKKVRRSKLKQGFFIALAAIVLVLIINLKSCEQGDGGGKKTGQGGKTPGDQSGGSGQQSKQPLKIQFFCESTIHPKLTLINGSVQTEFFVHDKTFLTKFEQFLSEISTKGEVKLICSESTPTAGKFQLISILNKQGFKVSEVTNNE